MAKFLCLAGAVVCFAAAGCCWLYANKVYNRVYGHAEIRTAMITPTDQFCQQLKRAAKWFLVVGMGFAVAAMTL